MSDVTWEAVGSKIQPLPCKDFPTEISSRPARNSPPRVLSLRKPHAAQTRLAKDYVFPRLYHFQPEKIHIHQNFSHSFKNYFSLSPKKFFPAKSETVLSEKNTNSSQL